MSWTKIIQGEELTRLHERLDLPPHYTIQEASTMQAPFYRNGELVKMIIDMDLAFMVAAGPGDLSAQEYYPLTGKSADIHAANEAAGLALTRDNVIAYVRFFTTFLQTDAGESFVIVESLNGYRLVNEDKPDQRMPEDMRFVCMGETADGDAFAFKGYMVYQGVLFGVSMRVQKNGYVEMLDDDPMGFIVRLQ
ncbi:hypothetical protein [Methylocapsa aurea]|uniref:hypothetical protein n=1 Tax=Methylocapsa aurea TaxID=663610 RepID=UPI0012EB95DA|nr:hypothetical protein [Methylocapsa aurea]